MDDFFFGGVVATLCLALLCVVYSIGGANEARGLGEDCVNYGKTQIEGKWYECKLQ